MFSSRSLFNSWNLLNFAKICMGSKVSCDLECLNFMRLNHLIELVIGCNARKLTCTSPVELSGNVALRFLFLNAPKFMHLMVVYLVSRWFFNRFLFGYQETGVFCGHFQLLELLWTNYCGFIFLFYHFLLSKRCCGGGGTCDDELRQCFLMLPHTNEVDRSPRTSLAEKGEWLLLLSPSNNRLQNCHWVRLLRR